MVRTYGFEFNQSNWGTVSLQTRLFFFLFYTAFEFILFYTVFKFSQRIELYWQKLSQLEMFYLKAQIPIQPVLQFKNTRIVSVTHTTASI